ncbi:MAG: diguanylate cyclase [Planctomycetota bacterium]
MLLSVSLGSPSDDELPIALEAAGYRVRRATRLSETARILGTGAVDLVLCHLPLPDTDIPRLDRLRRLCRDAGHVPLLLLVRPASVWARAGFLKEGVTDFLQLPIDDEELLARVELHLKNRERIQDLLERSQTYERLSLVDEKTGLFNMRYFNQRLKEEFARAQRHGAPLSLIIFDLDDFKSINDGFDYQYGDFVLRTVAELLTGAVREIDIPARFGGDEFLVLLPQTSGRDAERLAERLLHLYDGSVLEKDGRSVRITISVGIGTVDQVTMQDPSQLFEHANRALLQAKRSGKNAFHRLDEPSASGTPTIR